MTTPAPFAEPDTAPRVRALVLNYDGGDMVVRCVEHLRRTEWPAGALEIVVVDNASTDGSADELERRFPDVEVRRSPVNRGFAGGNNLGLRDLDGVDFVALVNDDAFVEPGWLAPLVAAFAGRTDLGAANAKLLFEPRFAHVALRTEGFVPGGDTRRLGVRVSGVRWDGRDVWEAARFVEPTFHGLEAGPEQEPRFRWSAPEAALAVVAPDGATLPARLEVRLAAEREKPVELTAGSLEQTVIVGPEPRWVEVEVKELVDIVQNAGSVLTTAGRGGDRGFWEADRGQYDRREEVFAWCGAVVLLSTAYLRDVGLFDETYFMYYEDFDLSWKGRALGWRYDFVPESRVRHRHAATAQEGSPNFELWVQRNRLVTLVKHAPARVVRAQVRDYLRELRLFARAEVVAPARGRSRPRPHHTWLRTRSAAGVLRRLPAALAERRRIDARRTVSRDDLFAWAVER